MGTPNVFETKGWKQTNTTFRAYVQDDATGQAMLAAAASGLTYSVTESLGPNQGTVTGSGALSPVATYIFALSTTGWSVDNVGYNFQATLPATCFPDAGDYVVDFIGTLATDGSSFVLAKCYHHAKSRS